MAADLDDAIWERADADAALLSLLGRSGWLWQDQAPPGEPLPHAVYFDPNEGEEADLGTGPRYMAEAARQINVFGTTPAQVKAIASRLRALLDPHAGSAPLALDDGREAGRFPGRMTSPELDPDKGPDGNDVWTARLFYDFRIGRVLGG